MSQGSIPNTTIKRSLDDNSIGHEHCGEKLNMETTTNAMAKNDVTTNYITCRMLSAK